MRKKLNQEVLHMVNQTFKKIGHPDADSEYELMREQDDEYRHEQLEIYEDNWINSFAD